MIKRITMFVATALLALALAAPAFAVTPAQEACEADGGVYSFSKGESTCTFTEETNPSGNPNAGATPFTETDTEAKPGQGGGGGASSDSNPNSVEEDGPVTNRGGGTPGGQQ